MHLVHLEPVGLHNQLVPWQWHLPPECKQGPGGCIDAKLAIRQRIWSIMTLYGFFHAAAACQCAVNNIERP